MKRIVLAYSGSRDTSLAIPRLARELGAEIVAVTIDVGQGHELADIRDRALALGAVRAHVIDGRDELVRDFLLPSLQAGALQDGRYPLSTAMTRALIARRLVDIARMEGASAIAYGTISAPARAHIENPLRALDGSIGMLQVSGSSDAPMDGSPDAARSLGIPLGRDPYAVHVNVWGRSIDVRDTDRADMLPEDVFALTRAPGDCPDEPAYVEVEFEAGIPLRVNGIDMPLLDMIESLETIAGSHGVGRMSRVVEDGGISSLEVHEAPGAVVLHAAHEALSAHAIGRALLLQKREVSRAYAELIASGGWFDAARQEMAVFVAGLQPPVTGAVRLRLFKGESLVAHCQAISPAADDRRRATVG